MLRCSRRLYTPRGYDVYHLTHRDVQNTNRMKGRDTEERERLQKQCYRTCAASLHHNRLAQSTCVWRARACHPGCAPCTALYTRRLEYSKFLRVVQMNEKSFPHFGRRAGTPCTRQPFPRGKIVTHSTNRGPRIGTGSPPKYVPAVHLIHRSGLRLCEPLLGCGYTHGH